MDVLTQANQALEAQTGRKPQPCKNPEWGDVSVACFGQGNPAETARKMALEKPGTLFESASATGPFVNFTFSNAFYQAVLEQALKPKPETVRKNKNQKAINATKKSKKESSAQVKPTATGPYLLEYSQPNPGKPMHLGHIRSTIVGDVCARCLAHLGENVVRLNYLNDRGAHIAELITALETFKDLPKVRDEKDLLAYYVKIKKEIDENAALKEKTRTVLEHLKDHQKQLEQIREMSYAAFERNYQALGVSFDAIPFESSLEQNALKQVQECLEKKLAKKEPDGTIITQLEPELSNTVLLRSNGTPLYFTSDLALAKWKWDTYHFSHSMIFTASEQNLHFRQLQLLLKKLGRPYAENYRHKGHGLIKLTEGKMSTRAGRVILLEDVIRDVVEAAQEQIQARAQAAQQRQGNLESQSETKKNQTQNSKQKAKKQNSSTTAKTAEILGIGALKFGVLRISLSKDITFDPEKEVQFEGDTASYVQYAHVRCCGILEKAAEKNQAQTNILKTTASESSKTKTKKANQLDEKVSAFDFGIPNELSLSPSEKELLKKIAEFPQAVAHVGQNLEPHVLCDYSLQLARTFTKFYDQNPVLTAENDTLRFQRLALVAATKNTLGQTLNLLGIAPLEKM